MIVEILPDKNQLLYNFSRCSNWEEKYLYIIELGDYLLPVPSSIHTSDYLISSCQSQVWIIIMLNKHDEVQLYGNSDSVIVRGLIAIIFSIYQGLTLEEICTFDVHPFFESLMLTKYLTPSRSQGLEALIRNIRKQARQLINNNCISQ